VLKQDARADSMRVRLFGNVRTHYGWCQGAKLHQNFAGARPLDALVPEQQSRSLHQISMSTTVHAQSQQGRAPRPGEACWNCGYRILTCDQASRPLKAFAVGAGQLERCAATHCYNCVARLAANDLEATERRLRGD